MKWHFTKYTDNMESILILNNIPVITVGDVKFLQSNNQIINIWILDIQFHGCCAAVLCIFSFVFNMHSSIYIDFIFFEKMYDF